MLIRFLIIAITLQVVMAKNILLTTTDTWVSKNVRYLYQHLKSEGHNVMLVGPLYKYSTMSGPVAGDKVSENLHGPKEATPEESSLRTREVKEYLVDGGEFSHLLPVHQTYFRNLARINLSPKFFLKSIDKRQLTEPNFKTKTVTLQAEKYGQDPLDEDVWYVNSNPLDTLSIALDVLINKAQFAPELILIGPNEGTHYTNDDDSNVLLKMLRYSKINGIPSIAVSTEDNHHIYYQDEKYFNIQSQHPFKVNTFSENIQFMNAQVAKIVANVKLPKSLALNINLPSLNHDYSTCTTNMNLYYSQIGSNTHTSQRVWKYNKFNPDMSWEQKTFETGSKFQTAKDEDKENVTGAERALYDRDELVKMYKSQNAAERRILNNCGAAVTIVGLDGYGGLQYNLESVLN